MVDSSSFKPESLAESPDDRLAGKSFQLRRGVELRVCHSPRQTSGQTPAIVFLHGGLGNRFNWRSQYEFSCAQGWENLTYDLAGHGQSLPYARYSIGRHCRDLTRLLHSFQINAPVLCCHSYGVPIGLEWSQQHPVSGLILICGGTHNLAPWWEIPLIKALTWGGRHLYRLPSAQQLTQQLTSTQRHQGVQQFFAESPIPVEHHPYRALEIFWKYNFFERRKRSINRQIPTLVISGGQDVTFSFQMGKELASHFTPSQHLHLPEAGHVVMAEYPEQINEAIATWLKSLSPEPEIQSRQGATHDQTFS